MKIIIWLAILAMLPIPAAHAETVEKNPMAVIHTTLEEMIGERDVFAVLMQTSMINASGEPDTAAFEIVDEPFDDNELINPLKVAKLAACDKAERLREEQPAFEVCVYSHILTPEEKAANPDLTMEYERYVAFCFFADEHEQAAADSSERIAIRIYERKELIYDASYYMDTENAALIWDIYNTYML